jgi:transposase
MSAYSHDLRQRVVDAVDRQEGSLRQLARRFRVSLSFIVRLLRLRRQTGDLRPRPHGGGHPPALDDQAVERLRRLLRDQPDLTLEELSQQVGVPCSRMSIWRTLCKLNITRKKKVLFAQEQQKPEVRQQRLEFAVGMTVLCPERLVFVDEGGTNTAMTRPYGRALQGQRVVGRVPGKWESLTLIAGLRLEGILAPWVFPGATDTEAFRTYVKEVLVPELRVGDVVIWDNLKPHQAAEVIDAVESAGAFVLPLPPWSPDLSPLEKLLSKLKGIPRRLVPRSVPALVDAIGQALQRVCPKDILGWFQCCGLATQADHPDADRKPNVLELIGFH